MASFNISEDQQEKIAEKLKNLMEDEGIQGEIQLTFTQNFEPEVPPSGLTGPCMKIINGKVVLQNPCRP